MLGDHQQRRTDYLTIPRTRSISNGARTPNSLLSGYTTNEADDERSSFTSRRSSTSYFYSSSDEDVGSSGDDADMVAPTDGPSYPGEDVRHTSRRELLGFYTYSFAAEVFVVCGLGAFIPIILEDLARASPTAVLAGDRSKSCKAQGISSTLLLSRANDDTSGGKQCVFDFFGAEINTASFAMYTFSISVLVQTLVVVTMSGAADHGRYRKTLLITFAIIGSVATMLFLPITPSVYLLGSLWALVGNICIGASFVLLNSFLPLLVRHHPSVKEAQISSDEARSALHSEINDQTARESAGSATAKHIRANSGTPPPPPPYEDPSLTDIVDPTTALLPSSGMSHPYPPSPAAPSIDMQVSTKISSYGVGIGYSAAVIVQVLSVLILTTVSPQLWSLRLVLFLIGLWWLTFTIPAMFWLRPRPGPPLATRTWLGYLTYSWKNLFRTALRARRLRDVLIFLAAWFMISDAIATVSGTAILFAKTTLGMRSSSLALINVIVTIAGIAGALSWSALSRALRLPPARTILVCICVFELIPIYGLLGYVPAIKRAGVGGLQQPWEIYPLAAVYGLVLGGLSSYCRSLFAQLIPPGQEAAFYALYAITDKGSSIFGPAVVGAITDATGEIRPAFWFLAVLIGLPIPLMLLVDVERGKREGAKLARETLDREIEAEEALRERELRDEEARAERQRQMAGAEGRRRLENEMDRQHRLTMNGANLAGTSSATGLADGFDNNPNGDQGHGKHGRHGKDGDHGHGRHGRHDHHDDHHHHHHDDHNHHSSHHAHFEQNNTAHVDHSQHMSHTMHVTHDTGITDTGAGAGVAHHG